MIATFVIDFIAPAVRTAKIGTIQAKSWISLIQLPETFFLQNGQYRKIPINPIPRSIADKPCGTLEFH